MGGTFLAPCRFAWIFIANGALNATPWENVAGLGNKFICTKNEINKNKELKKKMQMQSCEGWDFAKNFSGTCNKKVFFNPTGVFVINDLNCISNEVENLMKEDTSDLIEIL